MVGVEDDEDGEVDFVILMHGNAAVAADMVELVGF